MVTIQRAGWPVRSLQYISDKLHLGVSVLITLRLSPDTVT